MARDASPWARHDAVVAGIERGDPPPEDDLTSKALSYAVKGETIPEGLPGEVEPALALFRDQEARHVMNALVLGKCQPAEAEAALELPKGTFDVYAYLFFDRVAFKSVFQVRAYLAQFEERSNEADIYRLATIEGAPRLLDRYRLGPAPSVEASTVIQEVMASHFTRSFEGRGRAITSKTAVEAFKYGRSALTAALAVKSATPAARGSDALAALKMKLLDQELTKNPEDVQLDPEDVLRG